MARHLGLPILHRSDLLKILSDEKMGIAVAGTHGKTTTTTLLVQVLEEALLEPSFSVGGLIKEKMNANHTSSPYFIFEACESDGTLIKYHPKAAIITNVDNDHMDFYKTRENLEGHFAQFASQVEQKEYLFIHGDETFPHKGVRYGFSKECDLIASNLRLVKQSYLFEISFKGHVYKDVLINSPLKHNVLNGLAVFGLSLQCGIKEEIIRSAFAKFTPPKKRLEIRYDQNEVILIDDYGHHPNEIASTLESVRLAWPHRRIIALFQPHRYSRMKECMEQFKDTFNLCDHLLITDIYDAGERPIQGVTSNALQRIINKDSTYVTRKGLAKEVHSYLRPFDLVISFGAGDITKVHEEILEYPIRPLKVALVYGGKSSEHEVSCSSSQQALIGLDQPLFETEHFYIDRDGNWHSQHSQIALGEAIEQLKKCDVAFPVMHGKFGEDGTIQGMFEMLDIPYVGGPSLFNQISMDKVFTKMIAQCNNIEVTPFVVLKKDEPLDLKELTYPMFVKPVHLGSSVGVKRVVNHEELLAAIDYAFEFDHKIIIEKEVIGREIEFVVLEEDSGLTVFHPGEVLTHGRINTYEGKYGDTAFPAAPYANISPAAATQGKMLAKQIFNLLDGRGFARLDFFLDENDKYWFNEINPIPGLTKTSLCPQILEANGYSMEMLITRLIEIALYHARFDKSLRYDRA
jgi:D-alanine--D-alanine ligase